MGKKLLIADDSLTIQKVIKLALTQDGYDISAVSDGNRLLEQMSLFKPDIIVADVGLPGKSIFEIKAFAANDPDLSKIPFILMASAFEKVDEAKIALSQFDGRLTKPFEPNHLRNILTENLAKKDEEFQISDELPDLEPLFAPPVFPPPIFMNSNPQNDNPEESDIKILTESTVGGSDLDKALQFKTDDFSAWNIESPTDNTLYLDNNIPDPPRALPENNPAPSPVLTSGMDKKELDALIDQRVEAKLRELARGALSEIAERMIKQEIRKLLEAPPSTNT